MLLVILGLFLFVLLVVVHEWGHFIAARRSGVEVEEFGLGFPPRAKVLTKKKETTYTLNWLPIGGFVKLKGENDSATEKGSFGAAKFSQKAWIIIAGVAMNFVAAAVIFTLVSLVGMPQVLPNQFVVSSDAQIVQQKVVIGKVVEGSPAETAGLKSGDQIVSVANEPIETSEELTRVTSENAGRQVEVVFSQISKNGEQTTAQVQLREKNENGVLGVEPGDMSLVRSTWSAPIVGVGTTVQLTAETYKSLANMIGQLFRGDASTASQSVTGPVGIVVTLKSLADQGLVFVLFLIGIISLSLAVMNSLPIPALDGGRLFVMALFRAMRKPLKKETEEKVHGYGMMAILLLAVLITVVDVRRIFNG